MKFGTTEKLLVGGLLAGAAYWYYTNKMTEQKAFPVRQKLRAPEVGPIFEGAGSSVKPKIDDAVPHGTETGVIEIADRLAFLLAPKAIGPDTKVFVILHGGFATPRKAVEIGEAARDGNMMPNVLKPEGAMDQALAIMGRKAASDGSLVMFLPAVVDQQWRMSDMDYVTKAVAHIRKETGAQGDVRVSGAAAGLLIAAKAAEILNRKQAA